MSPTPTPTPLSVHAASARKIANYTQSISTGVTNLLTEIGRVSATSAPAPAPASAIGTDAAILLQLQALTGQIVGLVNRMDEVQRMVGGLEKRLDDMASSRSDVGWELKRPHPSLVSERHNELARLHNGRARNAYSMLLPLFNSRDERVQKHLCIEFDLKNETHAALIEFIGVGHDTITSIMVFCLPPEVLPMARITRTSAREAACKAAGPPTVKTREAAEYVSPNTRLSVPNGLSRTHNKRARAHNKSMSPGAIMPIHDSRNIPVTGFPATLEELTSPAYQADIVYFLSEYGKDVAPLGCVQRWFEFTGVDVEQALDMFNFVGFTWLD
ncbi:hypothetical protein Q9L58_005639 [Maublancomyces gigas]|uniref:Uncharacterized protein n=1 Tax=Discina gigas TaxID=1032678 RepID=A0ABR3GHT0_9PEZI